MRPVARLLLPAVMAAFMTPAVRAGDEGSWAPPSAVPAGSLGAEVLAGPSVGEGCCDRVPWSIQALSGYCAKAPLGPGGVPFGVSSTGRNRVNYVPLSLRLGYEWPELWFPDTFVQGTFEALFEYDTLIITRAFGNYFTGPSMLLRYNYIQPQCLLVPYLQGGAGIVFTDAYREPVQRLIGRWQEFLLQLAVGVRFQVTEQWSLDVEAGLQHISNAGLARRNAGINDAGVMVGFTYTFGAK
jgi:hypothetical protein